MGGNTKAIDRTTGKVVNFMGRPGYADKVDFRQIDRTTFRADVIATIKRLDGLHEESYGEPIWDPRKINSLLSSGAAFNGSSEHLFNSKISDEDFTRYKSQVGDIDLTIPAERAETLFELLGTLEQSPILPGKVWYVGQNKKSHSGEQINSLFAYKFDPDAPPLFFQIDFEAVDYERGRPTQFAKFSHSSSWEDIKQGIKGVFHKYLLRSLTTPSAQPDAILLAPSSPLYPPSAVKVARKTSAVKLLSFSVAYGLRSAVEMQRYPDEPGVPPELVGEPVEVNGKLAYKETPTGGSSYNTNLSEIFSLLFGKEPTPDEVTKFGSFVGVLEIMKAYLTDAESAAIYDDFVNEKLFGPGSQALDARSPEVDRSAKMGAVEMFRSVFPSLSEPDPAVLEAYYSSYKIRKESLLRAYISMLLRG
jgi:hypothetical protein